jgi:photosystem II stability/assembly factor-like uncharacterized protein
MNKFILIILCIYYPFALLGQWFPASNGIVDSVGLNDCKFVNENTAYTVGNYGYIYKTTNGTSSWFRQNSGLTDHFVTVFFINENTGWIAGGNKIIKTTDGGLNWFLQSTTWVIKSIYFANNNTGLAVGLGPYNVHKTTNGGNNWFSPLSPVPFADLYDVFMVDTDVAYAVGEWYNTLSPVLKTINGGLNWINQGSGTFFSIYSISFSNRDTGLFGTSAGMLKFTSNGGNNWLYINFPGSHLDIEHINNNIVYMTTGYIYILRSTDGGFNWTEQQTGNDRCNSVSFINENTGIAVGDSGTVYKTTNGGLGLIKTSNNIPEKYKLYQNYPNPFNNQTKIKFEVTSKKLVKLIIFDVLGRETVTLLNEMISPGIYETTWNANNYSSGIYFYSLSVDNFIETKKMILNK